MDFFFGNETRFEHMTVFGPTDVGVKPISPVFVEVTRAGFDRDVKTVGMRVPDSLQFLTDVGKWCRGELAQVAFPYLSADDREFLISGTTADEWDRLFPDEE